MDRASTRGDESFARRGLETAGKLLLLSLVASNDRYGEEILVNSSVKPEAGIVARVAMKNNN